MGLFGDIGRAHHDLNLYYDGLIGSLEKAMKENSIRRAVREGRAALGTGLKEFASRGVPWIIEAAGFDYCAIDHEHGAFDMETIANGQAGFRPRTSRPSFGFTSRSRI